MHECTSIIINSFHLFQRNLFNKGFFEEDGGRSLKHEWKQTGGGQASSLSLCSLCEKNCQKRRRHFFKLSFIYEDVYLCKKHCHLLFWVYKKIVIFSLFTLKFFIQKFISILLVKMSRDEQGGAGSKFEVFSEHTFWMTPKSFCCN